MNSVNNILSTAPPVPTTPLDEKGLLYTIRNTNSPNMKQLKRDSEELFKDILSKVETTDFTYQQKSQIIGFLELIKNNTKKPVHSVKEILQKLRDFADLNIRLMELQIPMTAGGKSIKHKKRNNRKTKKIYKEKV